MAPDWPVARSPSSPSRPAPAAASQRCLRKPQALAFSPPERAPSLWQSDASTARLGRRKSTRRQRATPAPPKGRARPTSGLGPRSAALQAGHGPIASLASLAPPKRPRRDLKQPASGPQQGAKSKLPTNGSIWPLEPPGRRSLAQSEPAKLICGSSAKCHQEASEPVEAPMSDQVDEMGRLRASSRASAWHWSEWDKSAQCLISDDKLTVCIHPECSETTAACRGSQAFKRDGNYHYWELEVRDKTYGTSVMFGLCTSRQQLEALDYCNLIGLDDQGWSLSHKGLVWHLGQCRQYTHLFPSNQPVKIGLLLDTSRGELSYFMNGQNLGVAFRGLNDFEDELYPVVASTAKCTRITITGTYCGYRSLLERSCFAIVSHSRNKDQLMDYLKQYGVPRNLIDYLRQVNDSRNRQTAINSSNNTTEGEADNRAASNIETNRATTQLFVDRVPIL